MDNMLQCVAAYFLASDNLQSSALAISEYNNEFSLNCGKSSII
jgi:hypothetical protein